ncbi:MAG: cation:dicarboxylase symporter family transporter [Endozoicomonas sp. (ex Botrylloides leachii)]|nr:cation:dicarboxylase symporter family transporter [Endozoicomonas sp. (ex Botrylloides leachii)]
MTDVIINGLLMIAILSGFIWMHRKGYSFSVRVFAAMASGLAFGLALQWFYGVGSATITHTLDYFNIVGDGYIRLLKMTIMPLILVSIIAAALKMPIGMGMSKVLISILGLLLGMTAVAALISITVTQLFHLDAAGLLGMHTSTVPDASTSQRLGELGNASVPKMLVDFIPANPFLDLTGQRPVSVIATVIFAGFIGFAGLSAIKVQPAIKERLLTGIDTIQSVVVAMVKMVLQLTPYGVIALMTKVAATSHIEEMKNLLQFITASYTALLLMFSVHLLLLSFFGVKPKQFLKGAGAVLAFAFTSRSSAGAIPMNIETQINRFGVPEGIANFSASIGATVGQNGCAGVYPAMLAMMVAPLAGIYPLDPSFIATLVLVVVISSFGVAGIGGGATFAALMVLSTLNLPVALVGLLIAVEPLIDMGRTALNVSGAITAGIISSRLLKRSDPLSYTRTAPANH